MKPLTMAWSRCEESSKGIRVGDDSNPTVFGSGDFGEAGSLSGIPLTSTTSPTTGDPILFDPLANVFIIRDTTGDTYIDGYDTQLNLPAPQLFTFDTLVLTPVGITDGVDGKLYAIGLSTGFGAVNPVTNFVDMNSLTDLTGDNVDITCLPGSNNLFVVRDTSTDTYVDRLDIGTLSFSQNISISSTMVGTPVGITDGADGLLYVCGTTTGFVSVDQVTQDVSNITLSPSVGTYVDLTGMDGVQKIYLLRDTTGDTKIDVFDISLNSTTYNFASFSNPSTPVGITDGPSGRLYIIGKGDATAAGFAVIDPSTGSVLDTNSFMDFAGSNVKITNLAVEFSAIPTVSEWGMIIFFILLVGSALRVMRHRMMHESM